MTSGMPVTVSPKWARHRFPCTAEYIQANCHGRCCEGTNRILVSLLAIEATRQLALGHRVDGGLLQPDKCTGKCPHKLLDGLCALHATVDKPFGCIASPFTLNEHDTLILRYRYSRLKCHGSGLVAYVAFRASLDLLFGDGEAARVCRILDTVDGDVPITATMPVHAYRAVKHLDGLKRAPCDK